MSGISDHVSFSTKALLLATALCLCVLGSTAQILVGPVAGGQVGWITFGDKTNKYDFKRSPFFGFHAGGSVSFRMQKKVFLQASILYTQRGKNLESRLDQSLTNKAKYQYIDLPILFTKEVKLRFGKAEKGRFYSLYFGAGPTISYWLSGKGHLTSGDLNENFINPPTYDLNYHVTFGKSPDNVNFGEMNVEKPNRIQLGLNFSAGMVFEPVGLNKFMVTARYELGHSFFSPDTDGDFGLAGILYYKDDLQVRNQGISLSLFYFIDLKLDQRNKGGSTIKLDKVKKGKRR